MQMNGHPYMPLFTKRLAQYVLMQPMNLALVLAASVLAV